MSHVFPTRCPAATGLVHSRINTVATINLSATGSKNAPKAVLWSCQPYSISKRSNVSVQASTEQSQTHPLACQVAVQPVCEAGCQKDQRTNYGAIWLAVPRCIHSDVSSQVGASMAAVKSVCSAAHLSLSPVLLPLCQGSAQLGMSEPTVPSSPLSTAKGHCTTAGTTSGKGESRTTLPDPAS